MIPEEIQHATLRKDGQNPLFETDAIDQLLVKNIIATMPDIKKALGTTRNKTALRKMKQLSYISSYPHGGAYYTL